MNGRFWTCWRTQRSALACFPYLTDGLGCALALVGERLETQVTTWHLRDLVVDHQTGKLRETAVWSNAVKAATLVSYIRFVTADNFATMTAVASGILITHEVAARALNQRQQKISSELDKDKA